MSSASQQSSSSIVKQRQIQALIAQLNTLTARTRELEEISVTTAEQAAYFRQLAGYHAAWFMATGAVMTPPDKPENVQ